MFTTIITPVDGSREAELALEYAIALKRTNGAELKIVWVIPRPEPIQGHPHGGHTPLVCRFRSEEIEKDEERAWVYMEGLERRFDLGDSTAMIVRVGDLTHQTTILAEACEHPLMILAARHGSENALNQNVAQHLVADATVPVLAIPISQEMLAASPKR
ncbi:MAG: universal stress protein [Thermomicrobiales bacterium]